MNTRPHSIVLGTFLATFLTLLLSPMVASTASKETQTLIDSVCRSMEDYQFCNQVFQNNLHSPDIDKVGLTQITIVEAQQNATNTLGFIRAQIPGEKRPAQLNHLKVCENAYDMLKKNFDLAFGAFNQKDYRGMQSYERDTAREQASCTTIFTVPPIIENPLNERNREMRILLTMAYVTGSLIVT